MVNLPEPDFIDRDQQKITTEIIAEYEKLTGKTLYPAQVERLLIDIIAYRETLLRIGIQEAAKQNLVAFARAPMLDYLGELVSVTRAVAQPAKTTMRFKLTLPHQNIRIARNLPTQSTASMAMADLLIPKGARIQGGQGTVIFATDDNVILNADKTSAEVTATCTESGVIGNKWEPGQINRLIDFINDQFVSGANITTSEGGIPAEDDERLRTRIKLASEQFSNAGSCQAYRFYAMKAHQKIIDVTVCSSKPGVVEIYPLLDTGLPDKPTLELVQAICSEDRVRPLTDLVKVLSPTPIDYEINAELVLYKYADFKSVRELALQKINAYISDCAARLGHDIVPSQIIAALQVPGVYQVTLKEPELKILAENEWAHCINRYDDKKIKITNVKHG